MKLLPVIILIITLVFCCGKADDPTKPDDQQDEEHDQGEISNLQYPPDEPCRDSRFEATYFYCGS